MILPIGLNAYKRNLAFVPEVRCLNMYLEADESGISPDKTLRIQRPGLTLQYRLSGSVTAMQYWPAKGDYFTIAGGRAYLGETALGDVLPGASATTVTSLAAAAVTDGSLYISDGTTMTSVAIPDDRVPVDVDQLNGYILVLTENGRFYWIVPGETTIDALDFATAESSGDQGRAIRRLGDEFFIFGSDSTEVWQATGDLDAPFSRAPGRLYARGCMEAATVRRFDNSLVWVGDDGTVYRLGSVPQAISGPGLDERIRNRVGPMSAWTFKLDGHEFYCLRIPGQGVFAYDASTQQWCEFSWAVRHGETVDGVTLAGDATGRVFKLDAANATDNGVAFERVLTATAGFMGKGPRNDSVSIGMGSSAPCNIRLRWKDADEDFPPYYDETSMQSGMDVATYRRLGQARQPQRTFEISIMDPVIVRVAGMTAGESWQGGNA